MSKKIAFLTAGGIAPCLSSSIGALIEQYNKLLPDAELSGYLNGYQGLLTGKSIKLGDEVKKIIRFFLDLAAVLLVTAELS